MKQMQEKLVFNHNVELTVSGQPFKVKLFPA